MVDVCTTEESNVTYELGVLEELQTVFNPEMAHASYIPFYCLIGRKLLNLCQVQSTISIRNIALYYYTIILLYCIVYTIILLYYRYIFTLLGVLGCYV